MSRAGHNHKPGFEGGQMRLIRRIPKRGFKNRNKVLYTPVNVGALTCFDDGSEITLDVMKAKGLVKGVKDGVKVLGTGDLDRKLTVKAQAFSRSAREKIDGAGGSCEVVPLPAPVRQERE